MTTCPYCNGVGSFRPLLTPRPPVKISTLLCETCQGKGKVDDIRMDWIQRGRVMREKRVNSGETIRDFARRYKLKAITVSRAEIGAINPCVLEIFTEKLL